jgi:hypothetical protein
MWKKPTSLENFRKDQGSTKESFLSNVLIVAKLFISHPSVPIPRRTLKRKKKKQTIPEKGKTQLQEKFLQREK